MLADIRRALRRRALKAAWLSSRLRERFRREEPPVLALEQVRRRLELLVAGLYGRVIPIGTFAEPPRDAATRIVRAITAGSWREVKLATNDGEGIRLPRRLDARAGDRAAIAEYQLLALEQAERVARGSAETLPANATPLERDLYQIAEGHAVDAALMERVPRFAGALREARTAMLARRAPLAKLLPLDRAVEELARVALGGQATAGEPPFPAAPTPADSLRWARETAALLPGDGKRYLGLDPVPLWGAPGVVRGREEEVHRQQTWELGRRMGIRVQTKGGDDAPPGEQQQQHVGVSRTPLLDPRRAREDARGLVEVRSSGDGQSTGGEGEAGGGEATPLETSAPPGAHWYPEWDCYARRYRPAGAAVSEPPTREGDAAWAARSLSAHAGLVREVKHRFGKLRAQRARLPRRRLGDELDLAAVVAATTDARAGSSPDDRLYVEVRPARRGLAIVLLVDVSGSTDLPVTDTQQVIDVEKDAMLFASEALDALGDRYAVLAFSGRGAAHVRVTTLKGFAEPNGEVVRRRMAALAPDANTRLGAAVRHATALLAREPAGHRLLLILSDGKPNDVGHYQGEYAVEDSRQAIVEARASGVYPYCLAVDREAPEYLARIFGEAGHAVLRSPAQLPGALLRAVRQLLSA